MLPAPLPAHCIPACRSAGRLYDWSVDRQVATPALLYIAEMKPIVAEAGCRPETKDTNYLKNDDHPLWRLPTTYIP